MARRTKTEKDKEKSKRVKEVGEKRHLPPLPI
jgi:hypothetical protein